MDHSVLEVNGCSYVSVDVNMSLISNQGWIFASFCPFALLEFHGIPADLLASLHPYLREKNSTVNLADTIVEHRKEHLQMFLYFLHENLTWLKGNL